jgi:predicted DNA-binding transcriptional regulator YafY
MATPRSVHSESILKLLRGGREVGYADLQRELELSQKQCRRIITGLEHEGIVRRTGNRREVRFALMPGKEPVNGIPELTEDDVFALLLAAHAGRAQFSGTPLADDLESAASKLEAVYGDQLIAFEPDMLSSRMHFGMSPETEIDADIFRTVRQALLDGRAIKIAYQPLTGKRSFNRIIDPYLLACRNGSWLLVAYCRYSEKVLNFSLGGIEEAEVMDEFVTRQPDFKPDEYFRDSFGVLGGEVHLVRLLVAADKAQAFCRKRYHSTQQIEETREDGSIVVSYEVSGLPEVMAFVRSWGEGVEVLEPKVD